MTKAKFEDILLEKGELVYTNVGDSMYPLIKDRDLLIIKSSSGPLKRLDIPLYHRDNGQYVLHRVLKVRENDYVICGDNRYLKEYGITDRHVIGLLTAVERNGRTTSVYSFIKRLYAHLWCDFFFFRKCFLYLKKRLK